jgi:hypothetical protein
MALTTVALAATASAEAVGFDGDPVGTAPLGWVCGSTDGGAPLWLVETDNSAPSPPHVLKQSGSGSFPWCVKEGSALADGFVEVKLITLAGIDDRAGGVVWRWKNSDNYYVARLDALDGNVSVSRVLRGKLHSIRRVSSQVKANAWHTLRVEFKGDSIRVLQDGIPYIELDDRRITEPGAVGVWTSADSVTAFDDFQYDR